MKPARERFQEKPKADGQKSPGQDGLWGAASRCPRLAWQSLGSPYLHAVWLVAHGLAPHVAHGARLWGLGDGREALRGLCGHGLWREGVQWE